MRASSCRRSGRSYVEACRARAQQATEAARRPGLEQAVAQRREGRTRTPAPSPTGSVVSRSWPELAPRGAECDDLPGDRRCDATRLACQPEAARRARRATSASEGRRWSNCGWPHLGGAGAGGRGSATPEGPRARALNPRRPGRPARSRGRLRERWLGRTSDLRGQQSKLSVALRRRCDRGRGSGLTRPRAVTELAETIDRRDRELERPRCVRTHGRACAGGQHPALGCGGDGEGRYLDVRINPPT